MKEKQGQGDWYDIIRRSDGKLIGSMSFESRCLVYTRNGMVSCRRCWRMKGFLIFPPEPVFFAASATASINPLIL